MKRFMVALGLGSLLLSYSARAEMPRSLGSTANSLPTSPTIVWHDTLETGWQESRKRDVPMVIYITSERCHYCEAMKRDAWCDETVRQRLSRGYVAIRLSPQQNSATLDRINVKAYPTTLVGIPRGKIIAQRTGYQPASALHQLLSEAKDRISRR